MADFKDGQLAPQGGEYYAWVKVSDAAGNERMQAGQIIVPLTSIVEGLLLPSGNQIDELVSGTEASGTIEEQTVLQQPVSDIAPPSALSATNAPPPISFGGGINGAAQPSNALAGMTSFNAGGQSNSPISSSNPSNILWGATAAAAIGAFAAEAARKKELRRAANAKINQARKLKQQAYALSQQLKKQKDAIDQALRNQAAYARVLGRKEVDIEKELRSSLTKAQAERDALERTKQKAYDIYRKQEVAAQKKITHQKAEWWENTKTFFGDKVISPFNSYIYQPYIKPATEKISESVKDGASWINEKVYKPFIKPVLDYEVKRATNSFEWVNENVFQPHVKPFIENTLEAATNAAAWVNDKLIEPYLTPLMEKAVNKISEGIAWANENLYQPRLQPLVNSFIGNVYQPHISPLVDKGAGQLAEKSSWINRNIYKPFIQPVVADIDQYIYQPYFKPVYDKVTDWWGKTWDEYGEWVHGALDTVGFIPGLGDIADGINGLIYLGEGRYLEASISALSIIPLIGDLSKGGKWGLKLGKEIVEEGVEKVIKEGAEEVIEVISEKVVREVEGEIVEKVTKESVEKATQAVVRETAEGLVEKTLKVSAEELTEKTVRELSEEALEKTTKIVSENVAKSPASMISSIIEKNATSKLTEEIAQNAAKKVTEETVQQAIDNAAGEVIAMVRKFGAPAVEILDTVDLKAANKLFKNLDDDVIEYVIEQGPEAVDALSKWSKEELLEHGPELALRATKDAEALTATSKLVELLKTMDPRRADLLLNVMSSQGEKGFVNTIKTQFGKILVGNDNFDVAKDLIDTIAENSIQYADGGQLVLGKWVDYGNGFTLMSRNTGSMHYNPHPEIWNTLGELGKNRDAAAWLVNKQAVQTGIAKGLPIEFTLEGVPLKEIETEKRAVELIFSGATDSEIMADLEVEKIAIRWQELRELKNAGYEFAIDEINNSFVLNLR